MRLPFLLVLSFIVLGCTKTDEEICLGSQLASYGTLEKNDAKRFESKYCSTDGYLTREEHEAYCSFHCLRAAKLKPLN